MAPQARPSLATQLDRDIHQIVLKIIGQDDEGTVPRTSEVYQLIKNSNSSLARKPKKMLEDSIERALRVISADTESEPVIEDEIVPEEDEDMNLLNRSITSQWSKSPKRKPDFPTENQVQTSLIVSESTQEPSLGSTTTAIQEPNLQSTIASSKSKKRLTNGEPPQKRLRTISHSPTTEMRLSDLGGVGSTVKELNDLLLLPMRQPERYQIKKQSPPARGILLHGPPGCGKTTIVNAMAAAYRVPLITIAAPSILSGVIGDTERILRECFEEAKRVAPSLILIDDVDAIALKKEHSQRDTGRLVSQLRACVDGLSLKNTDRKPVIVIATTTNPDSLDPTLRGTRFSHEISIGIPTERGREKILRALAKRLNCEDGVDFAKLAQQTPGFIASDLRDLVTAASTISEEGERQALEGMGKECTLDLDLDEDENEDELDPEIIQIHRMVAATFLPNKNSDATKITNADFFNALPKIRPAIKREGFAAVPHTTWADVGAHDQIRKELSTAITKPISDSEMYTRHGINAPSGVLLWGPPGCGKTLLAKAVANEGRANFISVKGPELLNKYVGESERAVRQLFSRARASIPCIVFFDEIDALAATRDDGGGGSAVRVVNTLLTELDGLEDRKGIFVIAATNRPDVIDPALLRPGRLEKMLYVGLPEKGERVSILRTIIRGFKIDFNEIIQKVAEDCAGFSGADLASLARKAVEIATDRGDHDIRSEDFILAKEHIQPSVTNIEKYQLKMGL